MQWIGLTGGIASGKSTVSEFLRGRGYPVVDADLLAREVVTPGSEALKEVAATFGSGALMADGGLDRKKMADLIFGDVKKREQLEAILHPRIRALAERKRADLEAEGYNIAFYDVPLLFEKKMESLFDAVVLIAAPPDIQMARLISRNGLSVQDAQDRLGSQLPMEHKIRGAKHVIQNVGEYRELYQKIEKLLEQFPAAKGPKKI